MSGRKSQATQLVELAGPAELFHDTDTEYAVVPVDGHRETYKLRSKPFKLWLKRLYYKEHEVAPRSQSLEDALGVMEGKARFEGPTFPVNVRLARWGDAVYLDLCDELWRVVRIDAAGWKVLNDSPVRFRRIKGMQALPTPSRGSIHELQPFVNVSNDDDFTLIVAWLLAALNPCGPYPVLVLVGEQGSAKSTLARIVRRLFDPNDCEVRKDVREPRDLAIAANNGRCIAMDNLSSLPAWLSDALCSLATGGGFATRTLYTDDDETLFSAQRPIVLNGITEIATRPDLLDRSIILNLPNISDARRRPEKQLWVQFEEAWPQILGGLLAAVSCAMRNLQAVQAKTTRWPRMADFAQWVTAAEPALGISEGHFSRVYSANRADANTIALEASPVVEGVLRVSDDGNWTGSATELLKRLVNSADETAKRQQGWPKNASQLSRALRFVAPNLRCVGVNVEFHRDGKRRYIEIGKLGKDSVSVVTGVTANLNQHRAGDGGDGDVREITVTPQLLFLAPNDAGDAANDKFPFESDVSARTDTHNGLPRTKTRGTVINVLRRSLRLPETCLDRGRPFFD